MESLEKMNANIEDIEKINFDTIFFKLKKVLNRKQTFWDILFGSDSVKKYLEDKYELNDGYIMVLLLNVVAKQVVSLEIILDKKEDVNLDSPLSVMSLSRINNSKWNIFHREIKTQKIGINGTKILKVIESLIERIRNLEHQRETYIELFVSQPKVIQFFLKNNYKVSLDSPSNLEDFFIVKKDGSLEIKDEYKLINLRDEENGGYNYAPIIIKKDFLLEKGAKGIIEFLRINPWKDEIYINETADIDEENKEYAFGPFTSQKLKEAIKNKLICRIKLFKQIHK